MGEKAEEEKPVVRHDTRVVDEVLLATSHDLDLAPSLLGASSLVNRLILLGVNDGGRTEGLWKEFGAGLVLHAGALGVGVSTWTMHHIKE